MRNTSKLKISIIMLGILFALSTISSFNIIDDQNDMDVSLEIRDETNKKSPKISDFWPNCPRIHIQNDNWSATPFPWIQNHTGTYSDPHRIENVTIDGGGSGNGIFIEDSDDYFIIRNCTITNAQYGIRLNNTDNGTLTYNNCSNNARGIMFVFYCKNNTISNNIANNNSAVGIWLELDCDNNTIKGNVANKQNRGIRLINGCDNNTLLGNDVNENTDSGIYLKNNCDDNTISGNTANDNNQYGIYLYLECSDNTVSGNNASYNIYGIFLWDNCYYNTISGNNCSNNGYTGIFLYEYCDNNNISGNTVNYNRFGIIFFLNCDNNIISGNTVNDNTRQGIFLSNQCDNNTISGTKIFENNIGIQLEANCFDNLLFYNYIFNNSNYNGFDLGSNYWDNGVIGNYWDDYTGMDADYDGIGDTPYNIPGGAGNKDNKPIMIYDDIFFQSPEDMTYEVGTVGHNIKWIVINPSLLPLNFNVYMDGTSVKSGQLFPAENEIIISVDGLDSGIYGFTLEINGGSGGTFTDGVWVTVTNTIPVLIATPDDLSYEVGEMGNTLSWTFSDVSTNNPTYTITRNGVLLNINNPCVSGEPIEISVDGLDVGTYGFTIEIDDGYGGTAQDVVWVSVKRRAELNIESLKLSFSLTGFNLSFFIYDDSGQYIDFATIQLWWNGADISDDVQNLGNGLYSVTLEPITVASGEDPILLKMLISASGYEDKQFETYLAVDPDTLEKEIGKGADGVPLVIILIAIISIVAGIAVVTAAVILLRKRRRVSEVI